MRVLHSPLGRRTVSPLQLVPAVHDLPPAWDGVLVTWGEWSSGRSTLAHHVPADQLACDECGTVDEKTVNFGRRPPEPGATFKADRRKRTRTGHIYSVTEEVPAWPVKDLFAFRCRHCGHDTISDERTGETWDLDASDYGDTGSWPTETLF